MTDGCEKPRTVSPGAQAANILHPDEQQSENRSRETLSTKPGNLILLAHMKCSHKPRWVRMRTHNSSVIDVLQVSTPKLVVASRDVSDNTQTGGDCVQVGDTALIGYAERSLSSAKGCLVRWRCMECMLVRLL